LFFGVLNVDERSMVIGQCDWPMACCKIDQSTTTYISRSHCCWQHLWCDKKPKNGYVITLFL